MRKEGRKLGIWVDVPVYVKKCNYVIGHSPLGLFRTNRSFSLSRNKKINQKPSSGKSQKIVMLLEINKEDTSPSFRPVRFPKLQIFIEMFRRNLQNPVWKRHVGAHLWCTNMAAGKIVSTSGTYFGYLGEWSSVLNEQVFTYKYFP